MAKAGTDFELLAKAIYEEMLSQEGYETISVKHDVNIMGRSGQAHQIDVYWEFKIAGITHRVAVECKDYGSTVSVGKIRDFYAALEDIGNIHGIFITAEGYQSGAIQYAEHKDIALKTIQNPTTQEISDLQGIKELHLQMNALCIENVKTTPEFDIEWIINNTQLKQGDQIALGGMSNEIKIIDSNRLPVTTIYDLHNQLPRTPENTQNLVHKLDFENGFLVIPDSPYPPLKIKAIHFHYDTHTSDMTSIIRFKLMAKAILKDIITGEAYLYNKKVVSETSSD